MEGFIAGSLFGSSAIAMLIIIGVYDNVDIVSKQAFDRGYMVECIGKCRILLERGM